MYKKGIDEIVAGFIMEIKRTFVEADDVEIIVTTSKKELDKFNYSMRELTSASIPFLKLTDGGIEVPIDQCTFQSLRVPHGGMITIKLADNGK